MISITGDKLEIVFSKWDLDEYRIFLQSKSLPEHKLEYEWETDSFRLTAPSRFAGVFGMDVPVIDHGWLPFSKHLKDFQVFTTDRGLSIKRFGYFLTTGLGKTHIQWELARQIRHKTDGKVLFIVPLNIISQTLKIGLEYFGLTATRIESRLHLKQWCSDGVGGIAIVNPEKFIPPKGESDSVIEIKLCVCILLDEASLLGTGTKVIKTSLTKSCRGVEYKYTFTATPARNAVIDYSSQAAFLEKLRDENEVIYTYFQRSTKDGEWKLKKNAERKFYKFMAGWSMYLVDPKTYGFDDFLKGLPAPTYLEHRISLNGCQRDMITRVPGASGQLSMFGNRAKLTLPERNKYGQIARGFSYGKNGGKTEYIQSEKPKYVVDLIMEEMASGLKPLVWTVFDEETVILQKLLEGKGVNLGVLHGKIPKDKRPAIIEDYQDGKLDGIISKASLLGFGLNFQVCGSMIFMGFDDSFEKAFQAIRRAYRYGQTKSVRIHIPYIPELEGVVWENVRRKQARYEAEVRIIEQEYKQIVQEYHDKEKCALQA